MIAPRRDYLLWLALVVGILALVLPMGGGDWSTTDAVIWLAGLAVTPIAVLAMADFDWVVPLCIAGALLAAVGLYGLLDAGARGFGAVGLWLGLVALSLITWRA
ncbi:MAG: hypothetical protein ACREE3_02765, partial [Stellaceae bacterium]